MVNRIRSIPMEFSANRFGRDCLQKREELGLHMIEVGKLVDLSVATVDNVERAVYRNMLVSTLIAFCNLYDLDPRDYFELQA